MATPERLMDEFRGVAGRSFDAAEATIEHAADSTLEVIRFSDQASAGLKQGVLELQLKALEIAEFNAQACLSYWRKCLASMRQRISAFSTTTLWPPTWVACGDSLASLPI